MSIPNHHEAYSVVVIGGGVAGLLYALLHTLLDSATEVAVVDHSRVAYPAEESPSTPFPSDHILLNAQTLEILHRFDLLEEIAKWSKPIQGGALQLHSSIYKEIKRFPKTASNKFYSGLVVEQWKVERYLTSRLNALGVDIYRFHVVTRLSMLCTTPDEYPVTLAINEYDPTRPPFEWVGPECKIMAKYVVGADGHFSIVRQAMQVKMVPLQPPHQYEYLCADVLLRPNTDLTTDDSVKTGSDDHAHQFHIIHRSHGSCLVYPYEGKNKIRIMVRRAAPPKASSTPPSEAHENPKETDQVPADQYSYIMSEKSVSEHRLTTYGAISPPTEDQVKNLVNTLIADAITESVLWTRAFSIDYEVAETFVRVAPTRGGLVLIGNACRGCPPSWSTGLNLAIQDCYSLAWRLVNILNWKANHAVLLHEYDNERLAITHWTFDKCVRECDGLLDYRKIFGTQKPNVLGAVQRLIRGRVDDRALTNAMSEVVMASSPGDSDLPRLANVKVISFATGDESTAKVADVFDSFRGEINKHVLLLITKVLPVGTKLKTMFGCERPELAERFSVKEADQLQALATRYADCPVTPLWVYATGTKQQNFNPKKLVEQLPADLLRRVAEQDLTAIDHEDELVNALDLRFQDHQVITSGLQNSNLLQEIACRSQTDVGRACSSGFAIVRPDGLIAAKGLLNDQERVGELHAYFTRTMAVC